MCKKCQVAFISPLRVQKHIIAKHFQGPMCRCKYCGKYSRNEVALGKHVAKKHRLEKEKELSQWQITKRRVKAAFKEPHPTATPSPPPPRTKPGLYISDTEPGNKKNMQFACESAVRGANNTTGKLEEHMATPHTPGKRYKTSDGCIYMNWKLLDYRVTTP